MKGQGEQDKEQRAGLQTRRQDEAVERGRMQISALGGRGSDCRWSEKDATDVSSFCQHRCPIGLSRLHDAQSLTGVPMQQETSAPTPGQTPRHRGGVLSASPTPRGGFGWLW